MRKVTQDTATAFKLGRKRSVGNSTSTGDTYLLHGHRIAWKPGADDRLEPGEIGLSLCDWNTKTTRERLNGILTTFDCPAGFSTHYDTPMFGTGRFGWSPIDATAEYALDPSAFPFTLRRLDNG